MNQQLHTRVLHVDDGCVDKSCPAVVEVAGLAGVKAVVGRVVSDPAVAAALDVHVGPGESVVLIPDRLYAQIREG